MEQKYYNIADTIKFLTNEYKKPYTEADIGDFISRGELTPCFPYEGALFKTFKDSSKTPYNKISHFKGFVEAADKATQKNIGNLSTKYKKVFIWDVVINNDLAELTDYETVQEYSIDHKLLAMDFTILELDTFSFFGQNSDCFIHYKTTKLCAKYEFTDKQGIEITYNIYRSYCHFHISQLANVALEYPKSYQTNLSSKIEKLETLSHDQSESKKTKKVTSAELIAAQKENLILMGAILHLLKKRKPLGHQKVIVADLHDNYHQKYINDESLGKIFAQANHAHKGEEFNYNFSINNSQTVLGALL